MFGQYEDKSRTALARKSAMVLISGAMILLAGCQTGQRAQLENVAKDWALAIRASQVIPVYPLTEDLQPGDVFLVPVSIAKQTERYEQEGFLPTDMHVKRLSNLDYSMLYGPSFWTGDYGPTPNPRPADSGDFVQAPRAAFPSYEFSVDSGGSLGGALPIQGIPFGLNLMRATAARGNVSISSAYTYGSDGEQVYRTLLNWYNDDPDIRATMGALAASTDGNVFLRVVTRVFLVHKLDVSLANATTGSAGIDVGAAQPVPIPDLNTNDPQALKESAEAYKSALETLSSVLNETALQVPGVSVRLTAASSRSVTLEQTFDRLLAIGYVGFDVKVQRNGDLSPPIPSFSVLSGTVPEAAFDAIPFVQDDGLSSAYIQWLQEPGNREKMLAFLETRGLAETYDPADLASNAELADLLREAQTELGFGQ